MWLTTLVSILYFGVAAWRFAIPVPVGSPFGSTQEIATAYFNGANFVLIGLFGLCCVHWPAIASLFHCRSKDECAEAPAGEKETVAVVVETNPDGGGKKGGEDDASAPADVVVDPKPAVKRQVTYLTNLKTFLTFIVVTHHTVGSFMNQAAPIQTSTFYTEDIGNNNPGYGIDGYAKVRNFFFGGQWFLSINQSYFMAAFFLISGYFCPKSLDRKGFRAFVADKIVRLGGPLMLWMVLLGPLYILVLQAYLGYPLSYEYMYQAGTCWFILWLLNFSIAYAVVAQFAPKVKVGMPHPFVLLVIGMPLCGIFYAISKAIGPWNHLGGMNMWNYGASMYIPFFAAGVLGGRNDWLKSVEEMKAWVVWTLRVIVVGFWILIFLYVNAHALPIPGVHITFAVLDFIPPVYAVAMTLAIMQLFHQYFNATPQSQFMRNAGASAYIVYVIQFWPMLTSMIIFVEILKAAGVPIVFEGTLFFAVGPDGKPAPLSDGWIWGGWALVFVLTQLIVWPLGFFARKLPILNKMF
ncbi:putative acyltransferase [Chloropicon primus]|uniref:Acyltransferase 3 domain-containing protein n=1 Tax=Chloropicon primus TaxID=1764295 RepID=A0A5B8MX85_9CHLO|nr:hypothetical protein A3770_16p76910 [Chloropicon primus]UPR04378.1 putative acyltransferase [Chloropicon primus]|eukprot:QDZ25173.1 hypothetical protein A3770_16p76910 [Chloropicon primus]